MFCVYFFEFYFNWIHTKRSIRKSSVLSRSSKKMNEEWKISFIMKDPVNTGQWELFVEKTWPFLILQLRLGVGLEFYLPKGLNNVWISRLYHCIRFHKIWHLEMSCTHFARTNRSFQLILTALFKNIFWKSRQIISPHRNLNTYG